MEFPKIDMNSWFYTNCKRNRKNNSLICQECPFRKGIEEQEDERVKSRKENGRN